MARVGSVEISHEVDNSRAIPIVGPVDLKSPQILLVIGDESGLSNAMYSGDWAPSDVKLWTGDELYEYRPGQLGVFGPELGFASEWAASNSTGANLVIIRYLAQASDLIAPTGEEDTWYPRTGGFYEQAMMRVDSFRALYPEARIAAVLFCNNHPGDIENYSDRLEVLVNALRNDLPGTGYPIAFLADIPLDEGVYLTILEEQRLVAATKPNVFVIGTASLEYDQTEGSLTGPAAVEVGEALFQLPLGNVDAHIGFVQEPTFENSGNGHEVGRFYVDSLDATADYEFTFEVLSEDYDIVGESLVIDSADALVTETSVAVRATNPVSGSFVVAVIPLDIRVDPGDLIEVGTAVYLLSPGSLQLVAERLILVSPAAYTLGTGNLAVRVDTRPVIQAVGYVVAGGTLDVAGGVGIPVSGAPYTFAVGTLDVNLQYSPSSITAVAYEVGTGNLIFNVEAKIPIAAVAYTLAPQSIAVKTAVNIPVGTVAYTVGVSGTVSVWANGVASINSPAAYTAAVGNLEFVEEMNPNTVVFDSEGKLAFVTPLSRPDTHTLTWASSINGKSAAVLNNRTNQPSASSARGWLVWNGKTQDGTYRYLVMLSGTQPSAGVRRGPMPFARASFTDYFIQDGYHTGPQIVSGSTDRYNLIRQDDGVETKIITENVNRQGPWGGWVWVEIHVDGDQISHRMYAETATAPLPDWQVVTDANYPTGLFGVGYQQGATNNYLAVAQMEYYPVTAEMTNVIEDGQMAAYENNVIVANSIVDNKARWT